MDGYAPAGGVVSTPADVACLAQALADGTAPGIDTSVIPINHDRGIFWIFDGHDRVWHNGETGGYSAYLTLDLAPTRRVIAVLADTIPAEEQRRIAHEVGDAFEVT